MSRSGRSIDPPFSQRYVSGRALHLMDSFITLRSVSYDIAKDGEKVAVLTFIKPAYRLGESVLGVVEFNDPKSRSKVVKVCQA